ncbi:hypothetical protein LCGC14_1156310, partial [marine sediment metagenome]
MRNKILAVGLVLSLAAIGMFATADICTNPKLGNCQAGGFGVESVAAALADLYASATAVWSFNDIADLGNDDVGTNDLTLVNTPTAKGGALGYAAKFAAASTQYARTTDGDSDGNLDPGSGVSWGFAGWDVVHTTGGVAKAILSKSGVGPGASGEYDAYFRGATAAGTFNCRFHDGTSAKEDTTVDVLPGLDSRFFFHCRHNATSNELEAGLDASWTGTATATAGDGVD